MAKVKETDTPGVAEESKPKKVTTPMEIRRAYLQARLGGVNASEYPIETRSAWKRELALMAAGLWTGPVRIKSKSKMAEEIIG